MRAFLIGGLNNQAIGQRLGVSRRRVHGHGANAMRKIDSRVSGEARRDQSRQPVSALVLGSLAAAVLGCGLVTASAASAYSGAEIVARAASQAGLPYCWDGGNQSGPTHGDGNVEGAADCGPGVLGFDCTGLTMYATGLPLAHDSAQATDAVNSFGGQRIYSKSELQPGDTVYFGGSFGDFDHAGVYAGGGMMWDADIAYWIYPDGVHERTLASVENELPFVGGVRLSHEGGPPPPPPETVSNLLTDGGFQGGGYGWSSINPPGGVTNRAVYENAALAREGTHYMEANTSPNGGSIFQDTSVNLPAEASATASIWARVNPGQPVTGQYIALCLWDLNSSTNSCDNLTLTHQWQQVQVTTTMPGAATDLRTQVYMFGEGNMDFDGAVLTQDLLTDGGFQGGGYGWSSINPPGGVTNRAVYENAALAREGTHYMEANTSPNGGSIFQDTSVNLPAEASATASIWARVNPGQPVTGQYIALCLWDLNSSTNSCDNLTLTHQWQQVQVTTTMPGAATDLRTQVYMFGEGNMDFDGAVLTQDLLTDGGFQGGGYGWSSINPPGGVTNRAVYENAALAREGTHYMEANTSPNGGSIFQDTSVNLPAEASATASIWARVNPGQPVTGQYIALCLWDLNSSTNSCDNLTLTHQWQQVQVTTTMPGAATDLRTQVYMFGEGNMDFDGAVLGAPQTAEAVYIPSNESPPVISGSTSVGSTLACAPGAWFSAPTALNYSWSRDGTPVAGADGDTYTITTADEGHALTCLVTASNAAGEATAASAPTSVPAPTSPASTPGGASTSSSGTVPADVPKGGVDAVKTGVAPPRLSSEQLLVKTLAACRRNKNPKRRAACQSAARRRYQHELKLARQGRLDRALAACKQIRSQSKQRACVSIAKHRYG